MTANPQNVNLEEEGTSGGDTSEEGSTSNSSGNTSEEGSTSNSSGNTSEEDDEHVIKVLSWNINGTNPPGSGNIRKEIVAEVVRETAPCIILLQEIKPKDTPAYINRRLGMDYRWVEAAGQKKDMNESQVLYNSAYYEEIQATEKLFPILSPEEWEYQEEIDKKNLNTVLSQAKDKVISDISNTKLLRRNELDDFRTVLNERICIAGLKIKCCNKCLVIFISFHNVYRSLGANVRARAIEGFCQLVTELHILTGCVVLAGADFNQQFVHPYPYPTILDYKPTPRRMYSGQIDYFILEPVDSLKKRAKPLNFFKLIEDRIISIHIPGVGILFTPKRAIIPHDPLLCTIRMHCPVEDITDMYAMKRPGAIRNFYLWVSDIDAIDYSSS